MSTRCLLIDDEPLALDALASLLSKVPGMKIIDKCQDAVHGLHVINRSKIDLVFLDIEMPEVNGLEMLRSLSNPPPVILTTAYREYAVEAFELDVIDYLVKPVSMERMLKAVNRYHDRKSIKDEIPPSGEEDGTITLYADKKTYRLSSSEILYIQGLKDYAMVHTVNNRMVTRQTMKFFEKSLAGFRFIRIHRSWIVPYNRISSWTNYSVTVADKEIPVGKTYRKKVFDYLTGNAE